MVHRLLFFLLLACSTPTLAQPLTELITRYESVEGKASRHVKKFQRKAQRTGLRIHQTALDSGLVVVQCGDLSLLHRTVKFWGQSWRWTATKGDGSEEVIKIRRRELRAQLRTQYYEYLLRNLPKKYQEASQEVLDRYLKRQERKFTPVLWGWKKKRFPPNQVWYVALGSTELGPNDPYQIDFLTRFRPYGTLYADTLRAEIATHFPQIDSADCRLVNRSTRFREMQRAALKTFAYSHYTLQDRIRRTRTFTLYFDKNKVEYRPEQVQEIVEFLNDSSYVVSKAQVRGMASVEGDSANNIRLMEERAQVLLNTLQKAQQDTITLETQTYENWPLFYNQLLRQGFDTARYSKAEWKALFLIDSVDRAIEPLLAAQRRADIRLYLYQQLEAEEQWEYFSRLYQRAVVSFRRSPTLERKGEWLKLLVAMRRCAEDSFEAGDLTWEEVLNLAPITGIGPEVTLVYAYDMVRRREQDQWVPEGYLDYIMAAHRAGVEGMADPNPVVSTFFTQQTGALQSYIFDLLLSGEMDPTYLCAIRYPENATYYPLILSYYFFVEGAGGYLVSEVPCSAQGALPQNSSRFWVSSQPMLDTIQATTTNTAHSRYYYFLKTWVLTKDPEIAKYTSRVGDYYHFDLMEVIYYNVNHWQVVGNRMYDEDISLARLGELVDELLTYRDRICPNSLNQLVLDYHLKLQQTAYVYPGTVAAKQLRESLVWVSDYYRERLHKITPEIALQVGQHLVAMNKLGVGNLPANRAFSLLHGARTPELMQGEYGRYLAQLTLMAAPTLNRVVPQIAGEAGPEATSAWQQGARQVHPILWLRYRPKAED